jgi:ABC-type transport system involved in multi-copper enzyme maturation permease subunit
MTATLTPRVEMPTSNHPWLPRLIPGILRLHRTALISVAVIYLTFTAIALTVVHQVGHPRAVILAGQVFDGTLYSISAYAFYLPFLVAVFIGAPLFSRALETGTFRFAWTQGVGRRRLVATTLMVFILELTVLSSLLGIVLSRLWFDLSPQFPGLWNNHVFFTGPWMLTFSSVIGLLAGALLGVVFRRVLTALAATTAVMITIYLWAIMFPFFQETLLWFAKRMPANYPGVPLVNGNYLAHYDYASVNFYLTDRSGHVMTMDQFNSQIYPRLPQAQKLALNQNAAPEFHRLGLQEWQRSLFHPQFHGFLMMWIGFGMVTVIALVVAIFVLVGGNDRLLKWGRRHH